MTDLDAMLHVFKALEPAEKELELPDDDYADSPMHGEESWRAPQDPGHKRSAKWKG